MELKSFHLEEYSYESNYKNVEISINKESFTEETVKYAKRIYDLYKEKQEEVMEYLLENGLFEFYGNEYKKDEIKEYLGKVNRIEIIDENWGTLLWINHKLDEHIIDLEFNGDLELSYVIIDG